MNKYALLTIGFILSACATLDTAQENARADAALSEIPQSWQLELAAAQNPQDWFSLFDDQLLEGYLRAADGNNFTLQQAEGRLRSAESSLRVSQSTLLPTVNANISATGLSELDGSFNVSDSYSDGVSVRWDPDIFGSNKARVRQAEALLDVQSANTERLRRVILSQTASAYIRAVEANQQLELARENLDFLKETRRISTARFEAGDIARDDLSLSELEFENAQASVENLRQSARAARRALDILTGGFGAEQLALAAELPSPANLFSGAPAQVLASRFDVAASRASLAAEIASLEATAADDWPSLTLSGGLGGGGANLGTLFDPDDYLISLTSALAGNLFDGGRNAAQIEGARADIDGALASYGASLRGAVFDVNSAFDRISTLERALASLNRARTSADTALRLAKIKYDLGETILVDVLTVQRRVNAIKSSRIRTESQLLDAQIAAYLALGGNITP